MNEGSLAHALAEAAGDPDTDRVWVHRRGCNAEPCTCKPFMVPVEELGLLGPEAVADKLSPYVEERA